MWNPDCRSNEKPILRCIEMFVQFLYSGGINGMKELQMGSDGRLTIKKKTLQDFK